MLVDHGELGKMALDPTFMWETQKRITRWQLIPAIVEKLPQYKKNCQDIEKVLKQHHKMQRRTMKINSNQGLKEYNWLRMVRNTKINEVNISIPIGF